MYYTLLLITWIYSILADHIIEKDDKIIGGKEVLRTYPYQVSLQLENENTYSLFGRRDFVHNCGGAIVSDNCVLTAAHCVTNYQPRDLSILAGTDKLSGGDGLRYFVRDVQIHPNYKEFVTSDIAITRIFGKFDYSERIAPIKYSNDTIGGYYNCTLTGWGFTNPVLPSQPNDLQRVFLSTITNHECNDYGMTVTNTEICTYPYVGKGACNGDSGGPLTVRDGDEIVGIVSYGTSVCAIGRPDVYTRVSEFHEWISTNCPQQRPWFSWFSWLSWHS